jgi:hypothetical protein
VGQPYRGSTEMKRVALLAFYFVLCVRAETQHADVRLTASDINAGSDHFIAFSGMDTGVYRISPDSAVHPLSLNIIGKVSTTQGSTGPLVSPNQHWVAFTQNHDLWLCDTSSGRCSHSTSLGQPQAEALASVDVLILAWSPDSRGLLLHLTAGDTEFPDCDCPDLNVRNTRYGFYRFTLQAYSAELLDLPKDFEFQRFAVMSVQCSRSDFSQINS